MEYWLKPLLSTSSATVPLTAERYHALAAARAIIDLCKEISLMMDVFGRSMVAYEATLHERAFAWAFTPENREPREFADETVPEVSLRVLTVLTAFRAYVDGSKGHAGALANPVGREIEAAFSAAKDRIREKSFAYNFAWELRNAFAHRRPTIKSYGVGFRTRPKGGVHGAGIPVRNEVTLAFYIELAAIIEDEKCDQKFRPILVALHEHEGIERVDLTHLLRELASDVVEMHLDFGRTLLAHVEAATNLIKQEVSAANLSLGVDNKTWGFYTSETAHLGYSLENKVSLESGADAAADFSQWKPLANLAQSCVRLDVRRRRKTYPQESSKLWLLEDE